MIYSKEVELMCPVAKGAKHEPAPIPEEGKWVHSKKIEDISGFTHGVGWCAPQQGACKLTLNVKDGIIEEALIETIGCSGMTHSAAMAAEILQGKTILEALNTDLVCDAINTAMRELFLQIVYGRTQKKHSEFYHIELRVLFLMMVWQSVPVLKILVKDFVLRLVQCMQQKKKVFVIWKWQKVM